MKIALFLKNERLKAIQIDAITVLLIQTSERCIENVEHHSLYSRNLNYISLWLLRRQVDRIYLQDADDSIRNYFKRIDVEVKTFEDLEENPILNLLLL